MLQAASSINAVPVQSYSPSEQELLFINTKLLRFARNCKIAKYAYVDYCYPSDVKMRGGKTALIKQLQFNEKEAKLMAFNINRRESLRRVSKIYKAGKELHCTIEWNIRHSGFVSRWVDYNKEI